MTISVPLAVRIKTGRADTHVTREVRDLVFRSSIPGGYASCTITLDRPLDIQADDIELFASLYVYDARHGGVVWEGRLEDPGRGANENGEVWSVAAVGGQAHTKDRNQPLIYVDRSLERWHRSRYSVPKARTEIDEIDEDTPALMVEAAEGAAISTSWAGDWIYRSIYYAGQKIARVRADFICGGNSSLFVVGVFTRVADGSAVFSNKTGYSTTASTIGGYAADAGWDNTVNVASLRAQRDTSSTTADENAWAKFYNPSVRCMLKNADGTDITASASYAVNNVDPVEVVADLLGRWLTKYDGANAVLIGSGVDIDQLAYPDGVTSADVLDDLGLYDPGFYWAVWESNTAGKYRFEYIPWPTTVRYEATVVDGFDSPGSATELYNAVSVRWRESSGRIRNTRRTQTIQSLTDAGLTRQAYIDISDDMGSATNAIYVGDNFLAEHRYPPNAGTLTVGRPILDNLTGRMVMPWEIVPGYLIRVRGVSPSIDSLNPVARDGVTIFKMISTQFQASDVTCTVELDSYSRTVARALSNLHKRRLRKR
jgi:hypothetical protein